VSIQDLRPATDTQKNSFSPPRYAIWVNSLWFSSLTISLTSALLATLLQQWTRRYIRVTQPLGSPQKRARLREFFFSNVEKVHFLLATDAVPALLHISVFLFFAGLLILLRHIDHTVFNAVVPWVTLCVAIYISVTILPIIHPSSPHYGPLAALGWELCAYLFFALRSLIKKDLRDVDSYHSLRLLDRLERKAEEIVSKQIPESDARILESLLNSLGEDYTQEKFFEAIPGFYRSKSAEDSEKINENLSLEFFTKFRHSVSQFLDETLSSDSISESARSRRFLACLDASHMVLGDRAGMDIMAQIIYSESWNDLPPSPEIGHILRRWRMSKDRTKVTTGSCIIARIIASEASHDDTWKALARAQLDVPEKVLKEYMGKGDSVLLANLIKTTELFFQHGYPFQGILTSISDFSVDGTLHTLRQDFCALWNNIVQKSESSTNRTFILDEICHIHKALHPTAKAVTAIPTSSTSKNDSLLLRNPHLLCADPQSPHPSNAASGQIAPVATSSLSSREDQPPSSSLQRGKTNIVSHLASDTPSSLGPLPPLRVLSAEIQNYIPPALGHSHSATTSHTLHTPQDASTLDPGVFAVAGERDDQDLNSHRSHQSDPPAPNTSSSFRSEKGAV
jgi:uncharacterized protein DUF6535